MTPAEAVRLVAMLGAVEMSLVRRDQVAGPLLAQAARAAHGTEAEHYLAAAARMARTHDLGGDGEAAAARKITQALCRAAAQMAQAAALTSGR